MRLSLFAVTLLVICISPAEQRGTPSVKCSKFDDRNFIIQYDKDQVVNSTALFFCKDDHKILEGPNVVTCLSNGKWSSGPPICKNPLNCSKFDDQDFVIFYDKEQSINSSAVFFCKDMNKKLEGSNIVTCLPNGKWSDDPPKCKSSPTVKCPKFDDMELFILYDNGQDVNSIAVFFCTDKRKKLHGNNLVTCLSNGQWSGDPPKCKVTCPSVEESEGMRVFYTKKLDEGSIAAFICSYPLTRLGVVWTTCKANGEWTDPPPKCISSSCSLEKLIDSLPENVVPVVEGVTSDTLPLNFSLHLICKNNMTLNGSDTAHCGENGTWEVSKVQCPPSVKCSKFDDRELIIHYDKEQAVNSTALFLCKDDHKKLDGPNIVTCLLNGQWSGGPPICKTETPYRNEARLSLEKTEKSNIRTNTHANRSPSTTRQPQILTTQSRPSEPDAVLDLNKNLDPTPYPSCACTYRSVYNNLVAFVGTEKLSYGSKVKNNDKIKFHCLHFGYTRLNGVSEIKCENCRSWHSSEFPKCVRPRPGDTILQFDGDYTILPGGIIGVAEGRQLFIKCVSAGIKDFPKWATTIHKQLLFSSYVDQKGHYVSALNISNAVSQHSGHYLCYMEGYRPFTFDIQVISPPSMKCSKFDERDYLIYYDKEQAVNSAAIFVCKDYHKILEGPDVVTCLSNGKWSSGPPTCKIPSCPLDQLFDVVPANVVPVMEDVASDTLPYNFSLRLTCENNMMLSGSDVAKCGQDGKWQVSRVQCISGCVLPRIENSELIIEPDKSFYRFGESVALSCSPGYILNSDVVRLMCLGTSWSESVPACRKE